MSDSLIVQLARVDMRRYVGARWLFVILICTLSVLHIRLPGGQHTHWLYVGLVLVALTDTAVLTWALRRGGDERVARAMRGVLVPDVICVAGFSYLFANLEIGFYPFAVLIAGIYALVMPRRDALLAGPSFAVAYLFGHVVGDPGSGLTDTVLQVAGAVAVFIMAAMISTSVARLREREAETLEAVKERERALAETQRRVSELQAISQITETIHSTLDFERVGPTVLDILGKAIGIETCCLFVIDKDKSETLFTASVGSISELPRDAAGMRPDEALADEHFACIAPFDHANTMVLFCAEAEAINALTDDDRLVLTAVASELVVAVENSRLYKLTKRLAITDELTGLANYRHLQSRIDREIERARRYDKHFSLIMLDVDEFKAFNDREGHVAGDVALAELARVMEHAVREVDLVARYGGEEFSLVMPETDAAGAFVVAEKIRESVAEHAFSDAAGEPRCQMTVSVGLATYPTHGTDRETLLKEADDALYRAKNGGKNRVRTPRTKRSVSEAQTTAPVVREAADAASEDDLEG